MQGRNRGAGQHTQRFSAPGALRWCVSGHVRPHDALIASGDRACLALRPETRGRLPGAGAYGLPPSGRPRPHGPGPPEARDCQQGWTAPALNNCPPRPWHFSKPARSPGLGFILALQLQQPGSAASPQLAALPEIFNIPRKRKAVPAAEHWPPFHIPRPLLAGPTTGGQAYGGRSGYRSNDSPDNRSNTNYAHVSCVHVDSKFECQAMVLILLSASDPESLAEIESDRSHT